MSQRKNPDLSESVPHSNPARTRLKERFSPRTTHGGPLSRGKRKTARPFSPGASLHLVLNSSRAKGVWSFLHRKNRSRIQSMAYVYARRFGVRIYRIELSPGRIRLALKCTDRKKVSDFFRVFAGRTAVVVSGAKKNQKRIGKFWNELCWTKLIAWGRDFGELIRTFLPSESGESTAFFETGFKIPESGFI